MPRIELVLPGEPRTTVVPVSETYRITVERSDGLKCSDIEAKTALSMICVHSVIEKAKSPPEAHGGTIGIGATVSIAETKTEDAG